MLADRGVSGTFDQQIGTLVLGIQPIQHPRGRRNASQDLAGLADAALWDNDGADCDIWAPGYEFDYRGADRTAAHDGNMHLELDGVQPFVGCKDVKGERIEIAAMPIAHFLVPVVRRIAHSGQKRGVSR